jgi:hypothetical protein
LTKIKENSLEIIGLPKMNLFWIDKKKQIEINSSGSTYGTGTNDLLVRIFFY